MGSGHVADRPAAAEHARSSAVHTSGFQGAVPGVRAVCAAGAGETEVKIALATSPQRILLIKPSAIGDVVHTLPILNLLRRRFPEAHISWLLTPPCTDLLRDHPLLNEVISFDRHRFGDGWKNPRSLLGLTSFTASLRRRNFDLV